MKLFSKIILALSAMSVSFVSIAQEDPSKESVIVDPFTYSEGISQMASDNVRSAVMNGFSNVGRFHVVDALTDSRLSGLYANRNVEDAVNDANWKTESETAYKALGVSKLIKGQIELLSTYTKKDDKGELFYYCDLNFTLFVFNINDGTMVGTKGYKYHELSSVSCEIAFNGALRKATKDMVQFCNEFFQFTTYILELGEADKKGAIKDLWISGGTEMGIANGTIFKVYEQVNRGGKIGNNEIGQVIAKEVTNGMTRCNIINKKDGEVIKAAFSDGKKLTLVLDRKRGDGVKEVGRLFGL